MPRSFSEDLRVRQVEAVEAGGTRRAAPSWSTCRRTPPT